MAPAEAKDAKATGSKPTMDDLSTEVDGTIFEQILEMDDDEDEHDFSKSIVEDFFTQAEDTFEKMDAAIKEKDLPVLSELGHFLKGSSATLGLWKVRNECEKIQNFGALKDEHGNDPSTALPKDKALSLIEASISRAKVDYEKAEKLLKNFFGLNEPSEE